MRTVTMTMTIDDDDDEKYADDDCDYLSIYLLFLLSSLETCCYSHFFLLWIIVRDFMCELNTNHTKLGFNFVVCSRVKHHDISQDPLNSILIKEEMHVAP